jgi:predicted nucleic acid-binding protein
MTERCVDASIAVKWAVRGEPFRAEALAFLKEAGIGGIRLIAPPILPSEADGAICKRVFDGRMSPGEARKAYAILDASGVEIVNMPGVQQRAREIAQQFNQRLVYDATYAALSELRSCEFWTADKAFYDVVKAVLIFVRYLPDYV